ncbi:hypothetical protein N658DRAFT_297550 [Parathielavia hyrcaniae]|uniref:Uncharacterized protein n=1 Tax=Parathielavia hyrcaniae TaxID=113614 RepID=A0AAN6PX92_9PEZI|nr:hypothetical protein N658DRAFT_297550 [Parathielavia hyrcaniae]
MQCRAYRRGGLYDERTLRTPRYPEKPPPPAQGFQPQRAPQRGPFLGPDQGGYAKDGRDASLGGLVLLDLPPRTVELTPLVRAGCRPLQPQRMPVDERQPFTNADFKADLDEHGRSSDASGRLEQFLSLCRHLGRRALDQRRRVVSHMGLGGSVALERDVDVGRDDAPAAGESSCDEAELEAKEYSGLTTEVCLLEMDNAAFQRHVSVLLVERSFGAFGDGEGSG